MIGGGLVGAAIAFGLRDLGRRLALLDEGDVAYRASRGNFGLIWVQGKGLGLPAYGAWTQRSARAWPRLAALLRDDTGIDVALRQRGGLHVCLSRAGARRARARRWRRCWRSPASSATPSTCSIARGSRRGCRTSGPRWSAAPGALDGDCNPLRLLRALHAGIAQAGGEMLAGARRERIEPRAHGFALRSARGTLECERLVLAAGLGNARLAPMVGLTAPVVPNKGHIIVLERVAPFLPVPLETIRQTDEGTVLIGDSQQERGFDDTLELPCWPRWPRAPCACSRNCATCASIARGRRCA